MMLLLRVILFEIDAPAADTLDGASGVREVLSLWQSTPEDFVRGVDYISTQR